MFSKLKQKVKQDSTLSECSVVQKTPVGEGVTKSRLLNDETQSTSSRTKSTDDLATNLTQSSSDEANPIEQEQSNTFDSLYTEKNNFESNGTEEPPLSSTNDEIQHSTLNENELLLNKIQILTSEINRKQNEIEFYQEEFKQLNDEIDNFKLTIKNFESEIKHLNSEKSDLVLRNAQLLEQVNLSSTNPETVCTENSSIQIENNSLLDLDKYQQQLEENKLLRDDLNDKNKIIKNLQQRLNDMKKTLQKEFKYQCLASEDSLKSINELKLNIHSSQSSASFMTLINDPSTASNQVHTSHLKTKKSFESSHSSGASTAGHKMNAHLITLHSDVNFQYLKHVVLKFLTSREYEALHLVKALSVLLNLTNDEEKILKETLEWKMSWFGTRPKIQ